MSNLKNVRIVMIETSHPGNIGAVARAMKTMCMSQLYLVRPEAFPSPVATARATGAVDLLEKAVVCQDLSEAISDCQLVIGASARLRSIEWPQMSPGELAKLAVGQMAEQSVAILFGREDSGLSNQEMDLCNYLLHIPANPDFSSLNIAAAVQIVCYEIYQQTLHERAIKVEERSESLASGEEMNGLFAHMESALLEIGFLKPPSCNKLLRRLRRIFHRAQLDKTDVNILRGVFSAAQGRKYDWQKRKKMV